MRLKQLSLTNFRKHKKLTIDFDNLTVITGANGSGKTSILEAIGIALFDSPRTTLKDTIKRGESYCAISIIFTHLEKEYLVRRAYGNIAEYSINDTISGKEACTEFLRNLFQIDGKVWDNVICLSQFSKRYPFDLPQSGRTSVINQLIGISEYEEAWEWLREVASTGKKEVGEAEMALRVAQNSIDEWYFKRKEWEEQLTYWKKIGTIPDHVYEALKTIERLKDKIAKPAMRKDEYEILVKQYEKDKADYLEILHTKDTYNKKYEILKRGICPTCEQPVDASKFLIMEESIVLPEKPVHPAVPERFRSELDLEYEGALFISAGYPKNLPPESVVKKAIYDLEENLSSIPCHDVESLAKTLEIKKEALRLVEQERLGLKKAMTEIPEKARIFLEQKASQLIEGVFPFASLKLDPGYAISVGEIPLSSLSGAESVMVVMAFRLALNLLVSNNLGILVLDEPTDALDTERKAKMVELVNNFPGQVIIVTHDDCFQESIKI